jgi:hypothetical protein
MMEVQITCPECGSSVEVYPTKEADAAQCNVCHHVIDVKFNEDHEQGNLKECGVCHRQDFYQQKDFNRKVGVFLFILASILTILTFEYTYGSIFFVFYLIDSFLFRRLNTIAICYKCKTIYRKVNNIKEIHEYDHEMNDRIVYSDHDFKGKPLDH